MVELKSGDLLPKILHPPPGPKARRLCLDLRRFEAPGINTLQGDHCPILWQEALGANVLDVDGNVYLDMTSGLGVAAVGHRHPSVVEAVEKQANLLLHGLADVGAHPLRIQLAARLVELAPMEDAQIYFAVSGADAVEVALKTACLATGKPGAVAFHPAYHGLTLGALAVSSRPEFQRPFLPQLNRHVHRLSYGCPPTELARTLSTAGDVGALIVEPIAGREGIVIPPQGWLGQVGEICRQYNVLVIADEVFTGFGRTGDLFAAESTGLEADLICFGKALGGGLPIAGVLAGRQVMTAWDRGGEALHTATFVAHPLACAAALAVLDIFDRQNLKARAKLLEGTLGAQLNRWLGVPGVQAIRGRGLLWGIELASSAMAKAWTQEALGLGVLILGGGPEGNVVQLVPPLTISDRQTTVALDLLERSLRAVCYNP